MQTNPLLFALPTPRQTLLLRAALLPQPEAARSWSEWTDGLPENSSPAAALADVGTGFKRLLALLGHHLRACATPADEEIHRCLRAVRLRERIRSEAARGHAGEALKRLTAAGVRLLLLRGFAFAESFYPEPSLRHCHDLDLILERSEWPLAERCLGEAGYQRVADNQTCLVLRHASGFPISLHSRLFRLDAFDDKALAESRQSVEILDQSVDVLTPPAALLHLCGHVVATGSHICPTWAADLWFFLNHDPDRVWQDPQWSSLLAHGTNCSVALLAAAALTVLTYMKESIETQVPSQVLGGIEAVSDRSTAVRKAEWSAALLCAEGRPLELLRFGEGWPYRASALRYLALPPTAVLRHEAGNEQSLASLYVQRFRRFLSASTGPPAK
jgi:hypothetical protein